MIAVAADVKLFLGITTTADDAKITVAIATAQGQLEKDTGRKRFEAGAVTKTIRAEGDNCLFLNEWPISFPGVWGTDSYLKIDDELVPFAELDIYGDIGEVYYTGQFIEGAKIDLKYTGGFASGQVPADLKQAVVELAAKIYQRGITGNQVVSSEAVEDYKLTYDTSGAESGMSDSFRRTVSNYTVSLI